MNNKLDTINKKHDILIIDDDLPTIRIISEYFTSKGFTCQGYRSGVKGINELRHWTPKVILIETGADGYFLKPFDFRDCAIILKYLKNIAST